MMCAQNADFCDEVTRLLRDKWNIVQKVSALEQPQLNPLHDCTGPLLKDAMAQTVREKQADWDDFLDAVLFLFRMSINPTTKFSPYSLMFSRKPSLPNQTTLSLLNDEDQEQEVFSTKEQASTYMTIMEEQQESVKQLVLANMNAAYKHEKKRSAKRKMHNIPEMTYKLTDPLFAAGDSPKKLKESLYLSFPVESMQGSANSIKTELTYHLAESGVH